MHILWEPGPAPESQSGSDVRKRRRGERGSRGGKTHAVRVRAHCSGRIYKIHGIDAIAAAALGVVEHVSENRQTAEVAVFADFVDRVAQLCTVKAPHGRGGSGDWAFSP